MVRLTDRPDMTLDVYRGRKTTTKQQQDPDEVAHDVLPHQALHCLSLSLNSQYHTTGQNNVQNFC